MTRRIVLSLALLFLAVFLLRSIVVPLAGLPAVGGVGLPTIALMLFSLFHYTAVLGPKLGHVPLLIPLAWFMMIYPSYVIANLLVAGRPIVSRPGLARLVWLSLIGAMVMTA